MLIISKKRGGKILYAAEKDIDGQRVLNVHRRDADGVETDEYSVMPPSTRPLLMVLNMADDIDDSRLKDIIQSAYGRKAALRVNKPDVVTLYHEFNEQRAAEMQGKRVFAVKETPSGS